MYGARVATTPVIEDAGPKTIADLLHVSQAELGRVLGCHQTTVSRKLRGEIAWRVNELATLSRHYDVPVSSLLSGDGSDGAGSSPRQGAESTPFNRQKGRKQTVGLDGSAHPAPSKRKAT
jgi:hypothetical protein